MIKMMFLRILSMKHGKIMKKLLNGDFDNEYAFELIKDI